MVDLTKWMMRDQPPETVVLLRASGPYFDEKPLGGLLIGANDARQRCDPAPSVWEPFIFEHRLEKFLPPGIQAAPRGVLEPVEENLSADCDSRANDRTDEAYDRHPEGGVRDDLLCDLSRQSRRIRPPQSPNVRCSARLEVSPLNLTVRQCLHETTLVSKQGVCVDIH